MTYHYTLTRRYQTREAAIRNAQREGADRVHSPSGRVVWRADGMHTPAAKLLADWALAIIVSGAWAIVVYCAA